MTVGFMVPGAGKMVHMIGTFFKGLSCNNWVVKVSNLEGGGGYS